jgi:hypothetical protein
MVTDLRGISTDADYMQSGAIYRYSVRTLVAYGILWGLVISGGALLLLIALQQVLKTHSNYWVIAVAGGLLGFYIAAPIFWLRHRPTIEFEADGILVSPFFGAEFLTKWSDVVRVEEIRRQVAQTGGEVRFYLISSATRRIPFNTFYNDLPELLESINRKIAEYHIEVLRRDYRSAILSEAATKVSTREERVALRKDGVASRVQCLEVIPFGRIPQKIGKYNL